MDGSQYEACRKNVCRTTFSVKKGENNMHVSNRKTIRRLSLASFKAAKIRNIITVAAIALTTILFTVILTVGMSIKHGFEQSNFRQAGSYAHGEIKDITEEQFEELKDDPLIQEYGKRICCGMP